MHTLNHRMLAHSSIFDPLMTPALIDILLVLRRMQTKGQKNRQNIDALVLNRIACANMRAKHSKDETVNPNLDNA